MIDYVGFQQHLAKIFVAHKNVRFFAELDFLRDQGGVWYWHIIQGTSYPRDATTVMGYRHATDLQN